MFKTEAQEKMDAVRTSLDEAIDNLSRVIIDKVYGFDDFSREYVNDLVYILKDLLIIRQELN